MGRKVLGVGKNVMAGLLREAVQGDGHELPAMI
jgi:hypothetical protein